MSFKKQSPHYYKSSLRPHGETFSLELLSIQNIVLMKSVHSEICGLGRCFWKDTSESPCIPILLGWKLKSMTWVSKKLYLVNGTTFFSHPLSYKSVISHRYLGL